MYNVHLMAGTATAVAVKGLSRRSTYRFHAELNHVDSKCKHDSQK